MNQEFLILLFLTFAFYCGLWVFTEAVTSWTERWKTLKKEKDP